VNGTDNTCITEIKFHEDPKLRDSVFKSLEWSKWPLIRTNPGELKNLEYVFQVNAVHS